MSNTLQFLSLGCLLLISTSYARDLQLECHSVDESYNNTRLLRVLNVCHVKKFNLTKDDIIANTQLSFSDAAAANTYTGVIIESSKFPSFPQKIIKIFKNMVFLSIAFSGMTEIEDFSFRNATRLQDLNLGYNKITKISEFTFAGADLVSLSLEVNEITEVAPGAFDYFPHLETLRLSSNKISALDAKIFAMLSNLKLLRLNTNPLTHIDPQMFVHNQRLSDLGLAMIEVGGELELVLNTNRLTLLDLHGITEEFKKLTLR